MEFTDVLVRVRVPFIHNPGYAHEGAISVFSVVTWSVTVGQHWTKNNLAHDPPQSGARA
jgi:hypothetical protein